MKNFATVPFENINLRSLENSEWNFPYSFIQGNSLEYRNKYYESNVNSPIRFISNRGIDYSFIRNSQYGLQPNSAAGAAGFGSGFRSDSQCVRHSSLQYRSAAFSWTVLRPLLQLQRIQSISLFFQFRVQLLLQYKSRSVQHVSATV